MRPSTPAETPGSPGKGNLGNQRAIAGASSSLRIIAIGVVFAFLYWASSVVIAVLLSVLLAYFLDPFVTSLEHVHIPRALGALLVLLAATAASAPWAIWPWAAWTRLSTTGRATTPF